MEDEALGQTDERNVEYGRGHAANWEVSKSAQCSSPEGNGCDDDIPITNDSHIELFLSLGRHLGVEFREGGSPNRMTVIVPV